MNTREPGILIVIEGIDGSGKTTQTKLLVDWIKHELKREVYTLDFPGYSRSPFGQIIGHYLRGEYGDAVTMDPFQTALLYAGDRMHSKQLLVDALERGAIVVLNRYVPSNIVYGCAKLCRLDRAQERDQLTQFNEQLEYELAGLPRPNVVIVLGVDPHVASTMIDSKALREYLEGDQRDQYEADVLLQQAVASEYRRIAAGNLMWHLIEANATIEQVQTAVKECVQRAFT